MMPLKIDKEYLVRRSRSAQSKGGSAFAHKVKNGGKHYQRNVSERVSRTGASKEVMVKITGGARSVRGIKNAMNYMSRDNDLPMIDNDGNVYSDITKDIAYEHMIDGADNQFAFDKEGKENPKITQNIVFSPPRGANVKPEDLLESARETLNKKYPDTRFMMAYHDDKKEHPHVHVVIKTRDQKNNPVAIKKADLRNMRTGFAQSLQQKGYDVKATHKVKEGLNDKLKHAHGTATKRLTGVYEVLETGYDHYNFDTKNKKQHYISTQTANKGVKQTFWGAELGEQVSQHNIKKGDLIKLKKLGQVDVKVPTVNQKGDVTGWKETKRNQWDIQNLGVRSKFEMPKNAINYSTPDKIERFKQGLNQFTTQKNDMLKREEKQGIKIKF